MKKIVDIIDTISEYSGKILIWAAVGLVIVLCYEVVSRYVFDAPTNWALETSKMLGATLAAVGWGYTHLHHGHVRVDVIYMHLSPKGKALIDVIMASLFLFPLVGILTYCAISWTIYSWEMGERMVESSWLPPAGPIRTVLTLAFFLFALQCVSRLIRDLYLIIRSKTL
jgi:TRAP-type mannitol/chloroaromatic compound transport system permease small subunit